MSEQNLQQPLQEEAEKSIVVKILEAIKQKIWLGLIIVLLAIGIGAVYNEIRQSDCTITEKVVMTAYNTAEAKEESSAHITAAKTYISTVAAFMGTGVVIDRANYYYEQFDTISKINGWSYNDGMRSLMITKYYNSINGTVFTPTDLQKNDFYNIKFTDGGLFENYKYVGKEDITYGFTSSDADTVENCEIKLIKDGNEFNNVDSITLSLYNVTEQVLEEFKSSFFDGSFVKNEKGAVDVSLKDGTKYSHCYFVNDENGKRFVDGEGKKLCDYVLENIQSVNFTFYNDLDLKAISFEKPPLVKSNIETSYIALDEFVLFASYKDFTYEQASEKVKLLVLAANNEAKLKRDVEETEEYENYEFFNIVRITLKDVGIDKIEVNASNKKILFYFGIGGCVAAVLIIYLISLFDKKITSKKELESITGVPLLTYIEDFKGEGNI